MRPMREQIDLHALFEPGIRALPRMAPAGGLPRDA
jgi:hypothetical protein